MNKKNITKNNFYTLDDMDSYTINYFMHKEWYYAMQEYEEVKGRK